MPVVPVTRPCSAMPLVRPPIWFSRTSPRTPIPRLMVVNSAPGVTRPAVPMTSVPDALYPEPTVACPATP